jgi:hypothetical protein
MKKKFITLLTLIALFLGSCNITQEYHFNKDLSGTYTFEIKMGDLINMIKLTDTTGNAMSSLDTLDKSFEEISNKYKKNGARNVKTGWKDDKTAIYVNFDFDNIEDLNSIMEKTGEDAGLMLFGGNDKTSAKISHKGNRKLSFDFPEPNTDTTSLKDIESMKDYITFETVFSFDRRIKSIDNKNAEISEDQKSFKFSGKIDDILDKNFTLDTNVKLKIK